MSEKRPTKPIGAGSPSTSSRAAKESVPVRHTYPVARDECHARKIGCPEKCGWPACDCSAAMDEEPEVKFEPLDIGIDLAQCDVCGVLVGDADRHQQWHEDRSV